MESSTSQAKDSLGWAILRWGLIGLVGLIMLIAFLWVEENWRGKQAWTRYKREWEAKGEKFEFKAFIPAPVPDEENFAMTPFLAPLFDFNPTPLRAGQSVWRDTNAVRKVQDFGKDTGHPKSSGSWLRLQRTDLTAWAASLDREQEAPPSEESSSARAAAAEVVLEKLKKYEVVLEELRTASRRRSCRFNITYPAEDPTGTEYVHLPVLRQCGMLYQLRASAELAAGHADRALDDVKMCLYLGKSFQDYPTLLSGLVRIALVNIAIQPIWEGLADRRWSEAQLKELQQELEKVDLLKGYEATMRGERAFNLMLLDYQRLNRNYASEGDSGAEGLTSRRTPSAMFYQNQLAIGRMYEKIILPAMDAGKHRVNLDLSTNADARLDQELKGGFVMYTIFAKMLFPSIIKSERKFANAQAEVDEAVVACALERYRLAHGQFPETLDALGSQFIEKLPPDLITGEPLKYRRTEGGQFILYSVGWNGKDDGGTVVMDQGSSLRVDITQGDWVWRYPGR